MPKISIINDEISDNAEEVIDFLKSNNLHYVEVRSFNKKNIANISLLKLRKYAKQFRKNNIKISGIASPLLKWRNYEDGAESSNHNLNNNHFYVHGDVSFEKIFKIAEIFDTKYIRIFSFLRQPGFKISDLNESIDKLILLAEKYDKTILIENEPICNINTVKHLKSFVDFYKSNRIKILFDLGNIYKQGGALDYDELAEIANQIACVHLKDYSFKEKEYKILGTGDINYKKFISWMEGKKPGELFYSLETHVISNDRPLQSKESVAKLKELLKEKRVKYGIVGCGRIFNKHALAIRDCKNSELVGVFDLAENKSKAAAKINDCRKFNELNELISSVDVVNVCTPHHTHAAIIESVLRARKYCLCEKPGSLSDSNIKTIKKIPSYKTKLFVVYQNKYNQTLSKLRDIVKEKKLGEIIYISGAVRWFRDKKYYRDSTWQGHKDKEGGILFNQGAHIIDAIISLLPKSNKISTINAIGDKIYHNDIDTEDIFIAQFKSQKTLINLEVTVSSLPSNLDSNLFVIFQKGRALVGGKSLESSLKVETSAAGQTINFESAPNEDIYGLTHKRLIFDLSNYVLTGIKDENLVGYDQACVRVELINNLYKLANK